MDPSAPKPTRDDRLDAEFKRIMESYPPYTPVRHMDPRDQQTLLALSHIPRQKESQEHPMPEPSPVPSENPQTHTCPDCGFVWKHGEHGGHSCSIHLRSLVAEFHAALHEEFSCLTPPDSAPCQASLMRGDSRCRCSKCRRARYQDLEARVQALGITQ